MIILGTLITIVVISIVFIPISARYYEKSIKHYNFWDNLHGACIVVSIVFGIITICCLLTLPKERDVEYFISRYENLKSQTESLRRDDLVDLDDLRNKVLHMNNEIDLNRIYCKSPWKGAWYSEKIGNLEKLTYYGQN